MKLVTIATALVAALSLFGCATENDGEGGASLAGLRPAKPSADDPKSVGPALNPAIEAILNGAINQIPRGGNWVADPEISAETITKPFAMKDVCDSCDLIVVLRDARNPGELNVLDEYGHFSCRIWLDDNNQVERSDCK